jgi:hypothetical protein
MDKKELRSIADECFEVNKQDDLYYQTADGQCFRNWHDANEHSKPLEVRTVVEVRRDDAKKGTMTAAEKVDLINACTTVEQLTEIEIGNKENPKAKAAMDAKLKEFAEAEAKAKK